MDLQTVFKDIFLTDRYFIKGNVVPLGGRLSNCLDKTNRRFVTVQDAIVTELEGGEVLPVQSIMLGTDEILFAHELIDSAGDMYRKYQSPDFDLDFGDPSEPLRPVRIAGPRNGACSGKVVVGSNDPIEHLAFWTHAGKDSRRAPRVDRDVTRLTNMKFPVTSHVVDGGPRGEESR